MRTRIVSHVEASSFLGPSHRLGLTTKPPFWSSDARLTRKRQPYPRSSPSARRSERLDPDQPSRSSRPGYERRHNLGDVVGASQENHKGGPEELCISGTVDPLNEATAQ
jgi:hypothetical protein